MRKRAKSNLLTQLNSGVTGLRSLGDPGYEVVEGMIEGSTRHSNTA